MILRVVFLVVIGFALSFTRLATAQGCDVNQFLVGTSPGVAASDCISGGTWDFTILQTTQTWVDDQLTLLGLYGDNWGTIYGDVDVDRVGRRTAGFEWSVGADTFDGYQDAVFVVDQSFFSSWLGTGTRWVSYLFEDISDTFGTFFTDFSFGRNDFQHLAVFGTNAKDVQSVPEIDASSAGIAFALAFGLLALMRERFMQKEQPSL